MDFERELGVLSTERDNRAWKNCEEADRTLTLSARIFHLFRASLKEARSYHKYYQGRPGSQSED